MVFLSGESQSQVKTRSQRRSWVRYDQPPYMLLPWFSRLIDADSKGNWFYLNAHEGLSLHWRHFWINYFMILRILRRHFRINTDLVIGVLNWIWIIFVLYTRSMAGLLDPAHKNKAPYSQLQWRIKKKVILFSKLSRFITEPVSVIKSLFLGWFVFLNFNKTLYFLVD